MWQLTGLLSSSTASLSTKLKTVEAIRLVTPGPSWGQTVTMARQSRGEHPDKRKKT